MGHKFVQYIAGVFKWVSGILVGLTVILNFAAVIMRYVVNRPIMWCEEVSLILFVSAISFAIIPMTYSKRAVKLDFFVDLASQRTQHWIQILVEIISATSLATVSFLGISLVKRTKYRFTPILQIPYKYIYSITVVAMFLSAIIFIYHAIEDIKKLPIKSLEKIK